MTDYNDGKWHGWNGGECPVHPKSVVEAVWKSGCTLKIDSRLAKHFVWDSFASSIIAFRVVKEYREPREWWIHPVRRVVADYDPGKELGWVHVREVVEGGDA